MQSGLGLTHAQMLFQPYQRTCAVYYEKKLMSMENSVASSPNPDENLPENSEKPVVLQNATDKKNNMEVWRPAKATTARIRMTLPPFCKEVYNHFISCLKFGEIAHPTSKRLQQLGFVSCKGVSCRRTFLQLLPRFEVKAVKGCLVFSAKVEEDVLVYRRTGKILVPLENIKETIRRAHLLGSNEGNEELWNESNYKHLSSCRTFGVLTEHFTTHTREFGITRERVSKFISQCRHCRHRRIESCKDVNSKLTSDKTTEKRLSKKLQLVAETEDLCELLECNEATDEQMPSSNSRFVSMAAHVPDKSCIWYDRESIANTSDKFRKIVMVFGEMRGEMALAVKGNVEAKQRLEAKMYCAQLLMKDHAKSLQRWLILEEDSPKIFRTELDLLKEEYTTSGQRQNFKSDIAGLLTHLKSHKLVLSPLLVREVEDYLKTLTDGTETVFQGTIPTE